MSTTSHFHLSFLLHIILRLGFSWDGSIGSSFDANCRIGHALDPFGAIFTSDLRAGFNSHSTAVDSLGFFSYVLFFFNLAPNDSYAQFYSFPRDRSVGKRIQRRQYTLTLVYCDMIMAVDWGFFSFEMFRFAWVERSRSVE